MIDQRPCVKGSRDVHSLFTRTKHSDQLVMSRLHLIRSKHHINNKLMHYSCLFLKRKGSWPIHFVEIMRKHQADIFDSVNSMMTQQVRQTMSKEEDRWKRISAGFVALAVMSIPISVAVRIRTGEQGDSAL